MGTKDASVGIDFADDIAYLKGPYITDELYHANDKYIIGAPTEYYYIQDSKDRFSPSPSPHNLLRFPSL